MPIDSIGRVLTNAPYHKSESKKDINDHQVHPRISGGVLRLRLRLRRLRRRQEDSRRWDAIATHQSFLVTLLPQLASGISYRTKAHCCLPEAHRVSPPPGKLMELQARLLAPWRRTSGGGRRTASSRRGLAPQARRSPWTPSAARTSSSSRRLSRERARVATCKGRNRWWQR